MGPRTSSSAWSDGGAQTHTIVADASGELHRHLPGAAGRAGHLPGGHAAGTGPGDDHLDDRRPRRQPGAIRTRPRAYGSATALDRTLVTRHSVTITGLARKSQYFFQVLSRDGVGNLASATGTFTTK